MKQPALVLASAVAFTSVSVGGSSICALDVDGVAFCWGDNSSGQVGNGGGSASVPVAVFGDRHFKTIAIAGDHACALSLDGEAFCWGENGAGQLGTGLREDSNEPVAVVGPSPSDVDLGWKDDWRQVLLTSNRNPAAATAPSPAPPAPARRS